MKMKIPIFNKLFRSKPEKSVINYPYKFECKSVGLPDIFNLLGIEHSRLELQQSLRYYRNVPPIFNSINILSQQGSSIEPLIFVKDEEKFIDDHPLLELLKFPNTDVSGLEFYQQLISYFEITGNAFIIAAGKINLRDMSKSNTNQLFVISPASVTSSSFNINNNEFGMPLGLNVNMPNGEIWTFQRRIIRGRVRYFYKDSHELYHIRTFSSDINNNISDNIYGMSPLLPLQPEIEQYIQANKHNLSSLVRGAKSSLVIASKNPIPEAEMERLLEQAERFYSGGKNAGRILFLNGGDIEVEFMNDTFDMDYEKLKKTNATDIYNSLKIPLPLVSTDKATFSNMAEAQATLFENAIIPLRKRIDLELTLFLMPRFESDWQNFSLSFDETAIGALQIRRNEAIKLRKEINVNSINELRSLLGEVDAFNGGDDILGPATNVPLAQVPEEVNKEEQEIEFDDEEKSILAGLIDGKGNRIF